MKTVLPCAARPRNRSRISTMPAGSRPLAGSSRINRSGSLSSAIARPRRCFMPIEYVLTRSSVTALERNNSSTSSIRFPARPRGGWPPRAGCRGPTCSRRAPGTRPGRPRAAAPLSGASGPPVRGSRPTRTVGAIRSKGHADRGRLAGAVGPKESEQLGPVDLEVEPVDGKPLAIRLGERDGAERRLGGGHLL